MAKSEIKHVGREWRVYDEDGGAFVGFLSEYDAEEYAAMICADLVWVKNMLVDRATGEPWVFNG